MRYLLDTNIIVHWLRGSEAIARKIDEVGMDNCCISEITRAELLFGEALAVRRGRSLNGRTLHRLFEVLDVIPITGALELYAWEKARLQDIGRPIEDFDLLIGCTAVSSALVIVTENTDHMGRIEGLRLENWVVR